VDNGFNKLTRGNLSAFLAEGVSWACLPPRRLATAILAYCDSDHLTFIRSLLETSHAELKAVVEYLFLEKGGIRSIETTRKDSHESSFFPYRMEDIKAIAEEIYGRDKITQGELDRIITVFIQAVFNRFEKSNVYITNDKVVLKKRLWFESHFPGYPLNIMSVEEASVLLDLFFKKSGSYCAAGRYHLNKGKLERSLRRDVNMTSKHKETIREIVKVRCPHCRTLYEENLGRCPHCGAAPP
jgi:hypothetical protein